MVAPERGETEVLVPLGTPHPVLLLWRTRETRTRRPGCTPLQDVN
ncbi:hypothetical protein [Umezawaea beigongshangensis]|nr:hypothetical protein [Umezawaea beigongshangensis]